MTILRERSTRRERSARTAAPLPSNATVSPEDPGPARGRARATPLERHEACREATMKALLAGAGAPVVQEKLATTPEGAEEFARRLPHTVAVKVDAEGLLHKTDIGGVELHVGHDEVQNAYARVTAAATDAGYTVRGAVVSQMAAPGAELIVGTRWDRAVRPDGHGGRRRRDRRVARVMYGSSWRR